MSDKRLIYNALQKSYRDGRDVYDFFRGGYDGVNRRFIFALVFYPKKRNDSRSQLTVNQLEIFLSKKNEGTAATAVPSSLDAGNNAYINIYRRMNSTARTHIVGVICLALPVRA